MILRSVKVPSVWASGSGSQTTRQHRKRGLDALMVGGRGLTNTPDRKRNLRVTFSFQHIHPGGGLFCKCLS